MDRTQTGFDLLLQVADDLDVTIVSGKIWPPSDGRLWFGDKSIWEILLPDGDERYVALAVAPGGPGRERIHIGRGVLDAAGVGRLADAIAEAGGNLYQGRLALLRPADWLRLYGTAPHDTIDAASMLDAAQAAGWPHEFGNTQALFLDDQPVVHLLTTASVGRNATLAVGDIAEQQTHRIA